MRIVIREGEKPTKDNILEWIKYMGVVLDELKNQNPLPELPLYVFPEIASDLENK